MHPKALENMKNYLDAILHNCIISEGWPVLDSIYGNISAFSNHVVKQKKDLLTINNVIHILTKYLVNAVKEINKGIDDKSTNGALIEIMDVKGIECLSDNIIKFIINLPRVYSIYFPMPSIRLNERGFEISDDISVQYFTEEDENVISRNQLMPNAIMAPYGFESNRYYLRIKVSGFTSGAVDDIAFLDALSKLKLLIYLGLANGLFVEKDPHPWTTILTGDDYATRLNAIGIDSEIPCKIDFSSYLPRQIGKFINRIAINTENQNYREAFSKGPDSIEDYFKNIHKQTAKLISPALNMEEAVQIKTAIEWAFEAKISENDTVSFLQTCIGLEAILGDDAENGPLTAILADRCAYLISASIRDRSKIRAKFRELYQLRSKLVHGRKVRLSSNEKESLHWVETILQDVITTEIGNLKLGRTMP